MFCCWVEPQADNSGSVCVVNDRLLLAIPITQLGPRTAEDHGPEEADRQEQNISVAPRLKA